MAVQAKIPMTPTAGAAAEVANPADAGSAPQGVGLSEPAPIWLQRLSLAVLVVFCLYLGVLLVYLPWWRDMWDRNSLLLAFPRAHHWLTRGPVRGLVSGVGLLDLWIGISEIVHYREYRR